MSPVLWANFGPLSSLVGRAIRPMKQPTLIVSLPRSGSSWVGSTLGRSRTALYLREPISQTHLQRHERRGVVFRIDPAALPNGYAASARAAFAGIPAFSPVVVKFPDRWGLTERRGRRVLVKEVNPLALRWLSERFRPRIIYLIRHPAAVAASFSRLGWMTEDKSIAPEQRFSAARVGADDIFANPSEQSAWAEHAALQAMIMKSALEVLETREHLVVRYEDLCAEPVEGFKRLYSFAGLAWDPEVEASIEAQTRVEEHNRFESYSLFRNSLTMRDAWRDDVEPGALEEMKQAFQAYDLPYYQPHEW